MADGILGLGSSGSTGLSQELIDKLKTAEAKSKVDPYTTKLETWDKELEKITEIETKTKELLSAISNYDLYKSTPNAFDQVTASTSGTSAVFSATDVTGLTEGSTTVNVTQLAQRDVYQTNTFTDKDIQIDGGNDSGDKVSIEIGGTTYDFSTEGKTYQQLVDSINLNDKFKASIEQVGDSDYRLIVKSKDSGEANALTITQTGVDLGLEDSANKMLTAKNMKATIDGVSYDVSSNTITIQGNLTMTAVELGTSTISLQKDTSAIASGLEDFVSKYNELLDLVNTEAFSEDSPISDIGSLKTILSTIKSALFGNYGPNDDQNIFSYGFSMDTTGHMSIDSKTFATALTDNLDNLKALFVGVAEKPGIGTTLKEYLDNLDGYDGALTLYGDTMADNKTKLEEEKTKAQEALDTKYSLMSQQFAAYTAMITQMENAFSGMKQMIAESTSSS
ncbi:MAG: flagellar filament capping protein FliD [Arcobacteraceae bacterium]|jgi:flagellar hook-associated protein 2|nr:flagellar filament capping protein FliD [Arcobacteraceae bacterium]